MKILFICGCLEPGKDGVGDYTRRLAEGLIKLGHQTTIIALNDTFVNDSEQALQLGTEVRIPVLRIGAALRNSFKIKLAKEFVKSADPDWLSLQFVPYAFQKKGLPFLLAKQMENISEGRKWHIMFHELWIGINKEASLKDKCVGYVQKYIIKNLVSILSPIEVATQSSLYKYMLEGLIKTNKVKILPLISNIRFFGDRITKGAGNKKDLISFAVFGTVRYGHDIPDFCKWLDLQKKKYRKDIVIHFIGKSGDSLKEWERDLNACGIAYFVHGFQPEEKISVLLSQADVGIASTPYLLIEKSGAVAAMIEHLLPVICVSKMWSIGKQIDIAFPVYMWTDSLSLDYVLSQKVDYVDTLAVVCKMLLEGKEKF